MSQPAPSIALEMSFDGIALHQFSYDGHWHELSRIGLSDAALREKMANMREKAAKIQGRSCHTLIWLPEDQMVQRTLVLTGDSVENRRSEAREALADMVPYAPSELVIQVGEPLEDNKWPVVGVRKSTMIEAREFAKSHGFTGVSYASRFPLAGFETQPVFNLPTSRARVASLAMVAVLFAGLVVGGGIGIRVLNPFNIWDSSPRVEDVAPYRGAGIAPDSSEQNILPLGLLRPDYPVFPALVSLETRDVLPYLPPRQLDATALDVLTEPHPPTPTTQDISLASVGVPPVVPAPLAALPQANTPDAPPSFGPREPITRVAEIIAPRPDEQIQLSFTSLAGFIPGQRPKSFANIRFDLESLPPAAARLSPERLAAMIAELGVTAESLSRAAPATRLLEAAVVNIISGLPPLLPSLRNGRAIPAQVPFTPAPETPVPQVESPVQNPLGFAVITGGPNPRPVLRPVQTAPVTPAPDGLNIIQGNPGFTPIRRPFVEQAAATADPVETPVAALQVPDNPQPVEFDRIYNRDTLPIIIRAAVSEYAGGDGVRVIPGLPARLPLLRSGQAIPATSPVNAAQDTPINPLTAEANALRPLRRPQSVIDLPAPIDPMMSDAAPASAFRPGQRNEAFLVNVARIVEIAAERPRANVPPVPADPPTINLPASASVQREATVENAINLRKTNLIGILGTPDSRTVMIRLASGRIISGLHLGESFSGWQIIAIGDDNIRIKRGRREEILQLP